MTSDEDLRTTYSATAYRYPGTFDHTAGLRAVANLAPRPAVLTVTAEQVIQAWADTRWVEVDYPANGPHLGKVRLPLGEWAHIQAFLAVLGIEVTS